MNGLNLTFRDATPADAATIVALVRGAYRGEGSRAGWTTEADLLDDQRIDEAGVLSRVTSPGHLIVLGELAGQDGTVGHDGPGAQGGRSAPGPEVVACCELADRGAGLAYFGMFAVRPDLQAAGLGRQVLAEAERVARDSWGAARLEMTVIAVRAELIAWYVRRGYTITDETRPFPYEDMIDGGALRDDLSFAVLVKDLG
jgi:GNAT superfamily N-acetyltransferase